MTAVLLPLDDATLDRCARALRAGRLVAFPTETVYGLGAHALDENAVAAVFATKGRPATDPLIVHAATSAAARALARLSPAEEQIFERLSRAFWPGPLTLVVRAVSSVPSAVTAGGETVGLRVPAHPVAHTLLAAAGVPVAAPSANRFGHVSPTRAEHVVADLGDADLLVLDGGACPVGIESTVVKAVGPGPLVVLRRGAVLPSELARAVADLGVAVEVRERHVAADTAQEAPGQAVTHYAPSLPTYVLASGAGTGEALPVDACAVVDLGGRHAALADRARAYVDLSVEDDAAVAARRLFAALRDAETTAGARAVLLPDLRRATDEKLRALHDRIWRAASGRLAFLDGAVVRTS